MKKVALITGGSRGIGLGIARELASLGFNIAINGVRPPEEISPALAQIRSMGVDAVYCRGSIASAPDRKRIIGEVRERYQRLDILVNNAGIAPTERRDILETTEKSFDDVIGTNLKGTYFLTQDAANWMILQRNSDEAFAGCIVNISSVSAEVASVNRGEYCVAKAGISMITQLFAVRLGEFDIPVYEVRPGIIATDMTAGVKGKYDALLDQGLCIQNRWGTPEDVGRCVGAIASGGFRYSTGQVFTVDGGMMIRRL